MRRATDSDAPRELKLYGVRLEKSDPKADYNDDGNAEPTLFVGADATFRLFGHGWTPGGTFAWTEKTDTFGGKCNYLRDNTENKVSTLNIGRILGKDFPRY